MTMGTGLTVPPSSDVCTLFSEAEISIRVDEIARDVSSQSSADILVVAILKGSFVFTADLIRALHRSGVRPQIDFMQLASYGTGIESQGHVEIIRDLTDPVEGRDVLVVDDILDSGRTLWFAREQLLNGGAHRVQLCVLLDKQARRVQEIDADFVGFECPDEFVVGYGLDHANFYRELPYIGALGIASP